LRVSEIARLGVGDVDVDAAKGRRPRRVPLWWDAGTLADIAAWKAQRLPGAPSRAIRSWSRNAQVQPRNRT